MLKNLIGNICNLIVSTVFLYSAYMSAPAFFKIWQDCGVSAGNEKKLCVLVMSVGGAICLDWIRRIFK